MEKFNFEKLDVYQRSLDFVDVVYKITQGFPSEERFGLADQFKRAAVSISLNIAEGSGGTTAEFKQFLKISKRSIRECVAIVEIAQRRGYILDQEEASLRKMLAELAKMLYRFSNSLGKRS